MGGGYVSVREFGQNITKVYEDRMSHAWAVMWVPVLNEKLLLSLNTLILEFKEKRGYTPPLGDLLRLMCAEDLEKAVLHPEVRLALQTIIEAKDGYMADRNRGFTHYMSFDRTLQKLQDALAEYGVVI